METIILAPEELARKALSTAETSSSPLLVNGEVQVCLGEPSRALVPCVPAAVGSVYDYGTGEQVIREISPALVRELVGAEGLGCVCIQYLEDRSVHHPIVM